jgi:alpha-tubulin suppressor-like RCC1 family protein
VQVTGLSGVTATAAGGQHTCAIVANGAAECWGNNNNGQLGINSTTNSLVPVGVLNMSTDVTAIIAGFQHTCALSGQGAVWCCGYNAYGQLGNGTLTDSHTVVGVSGLGTGVQALAAGDYHTCAAVNGTVECWGLNSYGELGNSGGESDVPVSVSGVTGATEIGAGSYDTCALNNGAIECWGYNVDGELGNNSLTNSYAPVQVSTLEASVQTLVGGGGHYCALLNSYPECWGQNQSGQLGNGASLNSASPVKFTLGTLAGWQGLALGQQHTCGIYEGAVC